MFDWLFCTLFQPPKIRISSLFRETAPTVAAQKVMEMLRESH